MIEDSDWHFGHPNEEIRSREAAEAVPVSGRLWRRRTQIWKISTYDPSLLSFWSSLKLLNWWSRWNGCRTGSPRTRAGTGRSGPCPCPCPGRVTRTTPRVWATRDLVPSLSRVCSLEGKEF